MTRISYGFLFLLALIAQVACSDPVPTPVPTMGSAANTALSGTPALTEPSESASTPTQALAATPPPTPTQAAAAIRPIPTASAEPANGLTTANPPVTLITPGAEKEALAALYEATGGLDWKNNQNWLSSADIGEWYGVTSDANGRVTGLDLSGSNLEGELPPDLGNLTSLEFLNISSNRLRGQIPPELGYLANLKKLVIRNNNLGGQIPPGLGALTKLEVLDLYVNELTGRISPDLGSLTNLRTLNLGHNQLSGPIPPELGNLTNLEELLIILNRLTGEIPPQLGDLVNLRRLDLFGNQLSGRIPPEFGNLGNVVLLNIVANRLSGQIPPELGNLAKVESLKLDNNQLSGEIPAGLGNLDRLLELGLSRNPLRGCIPASLRIQYYLPEELGLEFCDQSPVPAADIGWQEVADFIGPYTAYVDPVLVGLLYAQKSGEMPPSTVRLGLAINYDPEISVDPPLDTYIEESGGKTDGEYIWLMPLELVPSIICRPEVFQARILKPGESPSWERREEPYTNMNDILNDVVLAHRAGMSERQAALYAMYVRGGSVVVHVQVRGAEMLGSILDWLSQRKIYFHPAASSSGDVVLLLPAGQILPLAQQFPDAYLDAADKQGLPMLRSQWPPDALHFEKAVAQQYVNPVSDAVQPGPGAGIAPCSLLPPLLK